MNQVKQRLPSIRHYFVDEAGDGTLFDRRGRIIVGTEGCSWFFILGLLDVLEPESLAREMEELRTGLLADPYFKGVPSMQLEANKTALAFHAKDDVPEVRREVFSLLLHHNLRFFAVIRDKRQVVEYVRQRRERDAVYRYHPNELYDYLVRRLFKTLLHKDDEYWVYFARRGKVDRTAALREALESARNRLGMQCNITSDAPIHVIASNPPTCVGLQAADYFL